MSNQTNDSMPLPYAHLIFLTTHQMLYQEVMVESEMPLSENEVILKAWEQAGGKWEPGPIDENRDVNGIQILRQKEHSPSDSSTRSSSSDERK